MSVAGSPVGQSVFVPRTGGLRRAVNADLFGKCANGGRSARLGEKPSAAAPRSRIRRQSDIVARYFSRVEGPGCGAKRLTKLGGTYFPPTFRHGDLCYAKMLFERHVG